MAGIRKLRELSRRRSSSNSSFSEVDDDSRPISPDKQDKRVLHSNKAAGVGYQPAGLISSTLPPKGSSQQRSSSRPASKANSLATPDLDNRSYRSRSKGSSTSSHHGNASLQQRPKQVPVHTPASPAALTARLRRSYSSISRESSSSSVGASDSYMQLLSPAYGTGTSSKHSMQDAPTLTTVNSNEGILHDDLLRSQSRAARGRSGKSVSSRSSSRGITPPPASPTAAAGSNAVLREHTCTATLVRQLLSQDKLHHSAQLEEGFHQLHLTSTDTFEQSPCTSAIAASGGNCESYDWHGVQGNSPRTVSTTARDNPWSAALGTPPGTPADGISLPNATISPADLQLGLACIRELFSSQHWQQQRQHHYDNDHHQQRADGLAVAATSAVAPAPASQDSQVMCTGGDSLQQIRQAQHDCDVAPTSAVPQGATAASTAATTDADDLLMTLHLDDAAYGEFTREVAARIIQAHWRQYVSHRQAQKAQQADAATEPEDAFNNRHIIDDKSAFVEQQSCPDIGTEQTQEPPDSAELSQDLTQVQQQQQQQRQQQEAHLVHGLEPSGRCRITDVADNDVQMKQDGVAGGTGAGLAGVTLAAVAEKQQEQQQLMHSSDLLDDQSAPTEYPAADVPVLQPDLYPASFQQEARESSSRNVQDKVAPLGVLRRSMESRQLLQLQQYKTAAAGSSTAASAAQVGCISVADRVDDSSTLHLEQQVQGYQHQHAKRVIQQFKVASTDCGESCNANQKLQGQQAAKQHATEQPEATALQQAVPLGRSKALSASGAAAAAAAAVASSAESCGECYSGSSLGAEKLGNILAYLDAVDAEADEEAAAATVLAAPTAPMSRELSHISRVTSSSGSVAGKHRPSSCPISRGGSAAAAAAAAAHTGSSVGHKQHETDALLLSSSSSGSRPMTGQQPLGQLANLLDQHEQQQVVVYEAVSASISEKQQQQQELGGCDMSLCNEQSVAGSVGGFSMVSQGNRSAVLAESVFEGVRAKMNRLRTALADKEAALQGLQLELQDTRQRQADHLSELAQVHEQELAAAASDAAAAVSRHLAFIDRLMADKEQINRQLAEQQAAAKASEAHHAGAIAALKAGWAAELKRQQASWEAAHAARQEAWRAEKTKEIKEQTVKGLEVEVQRLITRHRTELASLQDKATDQAKVAAEQAKSQHEAQIAALKDKLRQDQDQALERERAAAAARLREACERYESQMQSARLRLLSDTDSKLEAADAAAREEKRKAAAALEAAAVAARQREELLRQDWNRDKEALLQSHARALDQAKAAAQEERSAWRAAVTEKIKRQAMEREEQLRATLMKERDAEIDLVIQRLEAEHQAAVQTAKQQIAAEHAATVSSLEDRLKDAQRSATRLGDKARAAAAAVTEADKQRDAAEQKVEQLRHELELRDQQLTAAKASVLAKEAEGRAAAAAAGSAATQALQDLAVDRGQLEAKVNMLTKELQQMKQQHEAEMHHVEYRVKGVIAKKDEIIQGLQQQLSTALEQMRGTEAVLAAQQAELYE